ncbi:histidine triad nucleotide-binding protein [Candidatus Methylopumilus rimovensis]|uniref:Histidine triad nucleotide-binding protein n=2 Tax=Candidatus Methylopumilus rimovensis TaxID=2588535 RepID=A0AAE6FU84_9PROT|nr:histidine triad nucleotide-binding protein [Candidatus Methylopumilus rimovensis]QDD13961.1 histidine triad nucleotide-binding protein [Candidatus Methylopumilus rimovensis]
MSFQGEKAPQVLKRKKVGPGKPNNMNCIFCKIIEGSIPSKKIFENDELIAFHDIHPIDKVHFLITPKKHIENLISCNEADKEIISNMLLLAPKLAKEQGLQGFRTMINSGAEGGQEVFHMHFHVYGGSSKLAKI